MAFADWQFSDNEVANAQLDLVNPIAGLSSLRFFTTSGGRWVGVVTDASLLTKGIEQGRLRTLIRNSGSWTSQGWGIYAMLSAVTESDATNDFYCVRILSGTELALAKGTNSNIGGGSTIVLNSAHTFSSATSYAIQLEWITDVANLGGVYLRADLGTALDFSNLVLSSHVVDSTAPINSTTIAEGIGGFNSVGSRTIHWDQTSLYELV